MFALEWIGVHIDVVEKEFPIIHNSSSSFESCNRISSIVFWVCHWNILSHWWLAFLHVNIVNIQWVIDSIIYSIDLHRWVQKGQQEVWSWWSWWGIPFPIQYVCNKNEVIFPEMTFLRGCQMWWVSPWEVLNCLRQLRHSNMGYMSYAWHPSPSLTLQTSSLLMIEWSPALSCTISITWPPDISSVSLSPLYLWLRYILVLS